jgi:hypothetical protein
VWQIRNLDLSIWRFFTIIKTGRDKIQSEAGDQGSMDLSRLYQESELGWALLGWYDFPARERLLIVGQYSSACVEQLQEVFRQIEFYVDGKDYPKEFFDAILVFGEMRSREECISFLAQVSRDKWLQAHGVLLWAADNRLGARFLCGDSQLEPAGECHTRQGWQSIFEAAGLISPRFHYVMPGWHFPRNIYTDECLPGEQSLSRMEFRYVRPENLIRDESQMLQDSIANGIFPAMANSFLIEWQPAAGQAHRAVYVDMTADKGLQTSALVCYTDGSVCKKPLFSVGSVRAIYDHGEQLRCRGIDMIEQHYEDRRIWMPYIDDPLLSDVLAERAADSPKAFGALLERWWQAILQSSDQAAETNGFPGPSELDYGPFLAKAYLDFVPTNCFFRQDKLVFFDQEYVRANYPAKFVLYRGIILLYGSHPEIERAVPLQQVRKQYGLDLLWQVFMHVDVDIFQPEVRGYAAYRQEHQNVSGWVLRRNQQLMARLAILDQQDLFGDMDEKKLILFGAGRYCEAYLQEYGGQHCPKYIIDNDPAKWGQQKDGILICSPGMLLKEQDGGFRVIICSKQPGAMIRQLEQMEISEYRVVY